MDCCFWQGWFSQGGAPFIGVIISPCHNYQIALSKVCCLTISEEWFPELKCSKFRSAFCWCRYGFKIVSSCRAKCLSWLCPLQFSFSAVSMLCVRFSFALDTFGSYLVVSKGELLIKNLKPFLVIWRHTRKETWVLFLSIFSFKFDHQFCIVCICWDTPSVYTGLWQWPTVLRAFKLYVILWRLICSIWMFSTPFKLNSCLKSSGRPYQFDFVVCHSHCDSKDTLNTISNLVTKFAVYQ